ncbi:MAG: hypothetical protein II999_11390 [Bacteroidaceae bacterium]|nr:hypothetical protein [Bacteroidaceae bacterium]
MTVTEKLQLLLVKINNDPTCLERTNWGEVTWNFNERLMERIIVGIDDDNVCDIAIGMMMEYYTLWRREVILKKKIGRGRDCLTPEEEKRIANSVENFIRRVKDIREETAQQRTHLKEWKSKLHNLVGKQAEKHAKNTMGAFSRNEDAKDTITHSPEAIIQYVMKLHPTYVSENWKGHYQELWEKVLEIPEVKAVIHDKGRQKNTTFNRNLVGNILHLMTNKEVLSENATKLTIALEGDENSSIRAQLGKLPKDPKLERSIKEIVDTFLP